MYQGGSYYQRNTFVYSLNVLNFKGMSSVNTSLSVKHSKTLKVLPLHLYENIQLLMRESRDKYSTRLHLVLYLPLNSHLKLYNLFHTSWWQCFK